MRRRVDFRLAALAVGLFIVIPGAAMLAADPTPAGLKWHPLPPLPDAEGFAAMFAGTCGDALMLAGGANFTGKRPWEGGIKQWYDTVWQLETPAGPWQQVGRLPQPTAYGVSASSSQGLVCAGGGRRRNISQTCTASPCAKAVCRLRNCLPCRNPARLPAGQSSKVRCIYSAASSGPMRRHVCERFGARLPAARRELASAGALSRGRTHAGRGRCGRG